MSSLLGSRKHSDAGGVEQKAHPINLDLHRAVFDSDPARLKALLATQNPNIKDYRGNTPLGIAAMLGRTECIRLLLEAKASVKSRNLEGWNPLAEAIAYGNRDIIKMLFGAYRERSKQELKGRAPHVLESIEQLGDFSLQVHWKFSSWMPLVGRILPADTYHIYKKGTSLRLDTTLVDFAKRGLKWIRGSLSFIIKSPKGQPTTVIGLDNEAKCYVVMQTGQEKTASDKKEDEFHLERDVDHFLSHPVTAATTPGVVEFSRAKSGFIGFRSDKTEKIGVFDTRVYHVKNINLALKKRIEHLTEDDLRAQTVDEKGEEDHQALERELQKELDAQETGEGDDSDEGDSEGTEGRPDGKEGGALTTATGSEGHGRLARHHRKHRPSLPPPPAPTVSADEYFSPAAPAIHLNRPMSIKEDHKHFKATVWMCDSFPLTLDTVLQILEMAAPHHKHVERLKAFVQNRLPPGFPVKIEMPIFPTVTATVSFADFKREPVDAALFEIPEGYVNNPAHPIFKGFGRAEHDAHHRTDDEGDTM